MRKTTKPAKKPVRKAAAVKREREGKQARARIKPHILEEAAPTQPEFDFHGITCDQAEPGEPCVILDIDKQEQAQGWQAERLGRAQYNSGPKSAGDTLWDCAPMMEHVLENRSTVELEVYAYTKYGIAYPQFTESQRRQKCLGLIAMYAMAGDIEVIKWALSTSPRS
jgi:hypothetical protein